MPKTKNLSAARVIGIVFKYLIIAVMVLYCITLLVPLFWMLSSSVKSDFEFGYNTFGFPKEFIFTNYSEVFSKLTMRLFRGAVEYEYGLFDMAFYSLIYSVGISAFTVFVTVLVAYVVSKYRFPGRNFLYALGIFVMVVPILGSMPSTMQVKKAFGVYNNMLLTILTAPSAAFSGVNFLLFYAAFKGISWNYAEAVFIDGGGHWSVLFKIMLPMVFPTMTALFVLMFLGAWNDYSVFLIWLPSYPSLSIGIYMFQQNASQYGVTMPVIMAGFVIIIIPTVTLYFLTQKVIMTRLNVGGLKG